MAEDTGGMKLWLRVVLFASLALNLVVVGIVAGFVARGGPERDGGPRGRDMAMPYARALSDMDRRGLRDDLRARFRDRRADAGQIAADYRDAITALQADPFERAAFETVLARQDARAEMRQRAGRSALIDVVAAMSASERSAYAARLSEQVDRLERRLHRFD